MAYVYYLTVMFQIDNNFFKSENFSNTEETTSREKIEKKWTKDTCQTYTGEVLLGYIHRHGFYFVEEGEKLFYDGLFYANKLEGYAQIFYNDGSNFQGLFKNNIRFGPGVLTYANGTQDVGFWYSQRIVRLGGVDEKSVVPRLASTPLGQLKLLKYRYLVPVCNQQTDIAYKTLETLGASASILERSDELYNLEVENKRNTFFNKKMFNKQFFDELDCSIDIVLSDDEENNHDPAEEANVQGPSELDIDKERVSQIKDVLKTMENKLDSITKIKAILEMKVQYCRTYCCRDFGEEGESTPQREKLFSFGKLSFLQTDIPFLSPYIRSSSVTHSGRSHSKGSIRFSKVPLPGEDESLTNLNFSDLFPNLSARMSAMSARTHQTDHSFHFSGKISERKNGSSDQVPMEVKNYLGDSCACDEAIYAGDLLGLEKELEAVTRDEMFFQCICGNLRAKLEKHEEKCGRIKKVRTKKIFVDDVIAWNNEEYCMHMMKHSFLHRRSEYMVNFKVSDILAGSRQVFGPPGVIEANCLKFLEACRFGEMSVITKLVQESSIDVNVCDSKGNNGVLLAAVNGRIDTIKALVNLGAKLDQENDEGLLPLSICFLQYLSIKHHVTDWETSFLSDIEPEIKKSGYNWYPNSSLLSSDKLARRQSHKVTREERNNSYIFDTSFFTPTEEQLQKIVEERITKPRSQVHMGTIGPVEEAIKMLLKCGANPNTCEVPLPPLILSLFTENADLVELVLDAHADLTITIGEDLTCLHIMACLRYIQENVTICSTLLSYNFDPTLKTTAEHWPEQKQIILGQGVNSEDVEDNGKNPVHILVMRRDFPFDSCFYLQQMVTMFNDTCIDFNEKYLGHTPLSLATLVGNQRLVETLMTLGSSDPYILLDNNMGNVLTVYCLKRYEDIIPQNATEILQYLVEFGVNPLKPVGEFENALAFMENEYKIPIEKKGKKDKSSDGYKIGQSNNPLQNSVNEYLKELSRKTIINYIQIEAVEALYNIIEENLSEHPYVTILAEFLEPNLVIPNLKILFTYNQIKSERLDKTICLQIIDIVISHQKERPPKKGKGKPGLVKAKSKIKSESKLNKSGLEINKIMINPFEYDFIFDMTDFSKMKKSDINYKLMPPGLDNISKYKVCFHCLKKRNKDLVQCPRCQLIYFCSESCNKANIKICNLHPCSNNFYATESKRLQSSQTVEESENLTEFCKRVRDNCQERWRKKIEEKIEMERQRFLEEIKNDTYGTKRLRMMKQSRILSKTPTLVSLIGSTNEFFKIDDDHWKEPNDSIANKTISMAEKSDHLIKGTKKHDDVQHPKMRQSVNPLLEEVINRNKIVATTMAGNKPKLNCKCRKCKMTVQQMATMSTCECLSKEKVEEKIKKRLRSRTKETVIDVQKLRQMPKRYQEFIELLAKYFPDVDFSSLLLPYACYSNGHLYYKFLDKDLYTKTYSMI